MQDKNIIRPANRKAKTVLGLGNGLLNKLALLAALPVSVFSGDYMVRRLKYFRRVHRELRKQVKHITLTAEMQRRCLNQYATLLKSFQSQMSKVSNRELERHALNPAVEAIVVLYDEILNYNRLSENLNHQGKACPCLQHLVKASQISLKVAEDKLACLGIKRIEPVEGQEIDPVEHYCCCSVKTDNHSLHGKVNKLMVPGLMYRGKVIRQARVSVFRYENMGDNLVSKGDYNENDSN